jgi:hypothetical protein
VPLTAKVAEGEVVPIPTVRVVVAYTNPPLSIFTEPAKVDVAIVLVASTNGTVVLAAKFKRKFLRETPPIIRFPPITASPATDMSPPKVDVAEPVTVSPVVTTGAFVGVFDEPEDVTTPREDPKNGMVPDSTCFTMKLASESCRWV